MKKIQQKIISSVIFLAIFFIAVVPHVGYAQTAVSAVSSAVSAIPTAYNIATHAPIDWVNSIITTVSTEILEFVSLFVAAMGTFLSLSINITTHIKDIYTAIPAINAVWITIRNISSIFIIFALLYFSIMTIFQSETSRLKQLIINIFIAGLLINFSLFFVKVLVDASNLVSLQFYNAIAPNTATNLTTTSVFNDGGLSNVFMNSLKIQTIYNAASTGGGLTVTGNIIFSTVGGILIMITAGLSFLGAAIAFTARTAILLFIMALSPLYFVGIIFPDIKSKLSEPMVKMLKQQLIFMPVYLFFMYVALRIISDPGFSSAVNTTASSTSNFALVWIGIIVQYVIALIFITIPLIAALQLGATGMKWVPGGLQVSKTLGGFFGQHIIGRGAKSIADSEKFKDFTANSPLLGSIAGSGLGKISGATFGGTKGGYDKRFGNYVKKQKDLAKKLGFNQADVDNGLKEYDNMAIKLQRAKLIIDQGEKNRATARNSNTPFSASSERAISEAKKLAESLQNRMGVTSTNAEEIKNRRSVMENTFKQGRATIFAKNNEEGINPITRAARQEASESIRKELKKGKRDKAVDAIKELLDDTEKKDAKPDEKPKDK